MPRTPLKRLLILLICVSASLWASAWIVCEANPEVQFWHHAFQRKSTELTALQNAHPHDPVVIFAGGSSCAFSIMPEVIKERTGMEAYNMGGHAGAGPRLLSAFALQHARPGDVVVLALEIETIVSAEAGEVSQVGLALAHCQGNDQLVVGAPVLENSLSWKDRLTFLRPGSRFGAAMLGKKLSGRPLYRYQAENFCFGGRIETLYTDGANLPEPKFAKPRKLSESGKALLNGLVRWAEVHQVKLCFSLPWALTQPEAAPANREFHKAFAAEVATYMPVLEDDHFGVATEMNYFSDTSYHLTHEGAQARSEAVAKGLILAGLKK